MVRVLIAPPITPRHGKISGDGVDRPGLAGIRSLRKHVDLWVRLALQISSPCLLSGELRGRRHSRLLTPSSGQALQPAVPWGEPRSEAAHP
jgi:hypothetical protein